MDYQKIKYFLTAAESKSFSEAARKCFISPQALTKQITLLEEELGVTLFVRSSRNIALTEIGEFARERFFHVNKTLDMALDDIKKKSQLDENHVRIGVFSALAKAPMVSELLTMIMANYPQYKLELTVADLFDLRMMMLAGDLDLCITNTHEEEEWADFSTLSLATGKAKVVVSLYHPWAVKDTITVEDMKKMPFLRMDRHIKDYNLPESVSFYETIPCSDVYRVANFDTLYVRLEQGDCFAIFPKAFADAEHSHFKFFDIPYRDFVYHTACILPAHEPRKAIRDISNLIAEEYNLALS